MPKGNGKSPGVRYNWPDLKAEWIRRNVSEGISLNKFRIEKTIAGQTIFYAHVEDDAWLEARDSLLRKAFEKAENKNAAELADKYRLQGQIYDAAEKQIAFWMQKNVSNNGIVYPIDPFELVAVLRSAQIALNSKRLMEGKSTEIKEDRRIIVSALVKLQEEIKANNPGLLNSTHTIENLDLAFDEETE